MDAVFSDEQMASNCFSCGKRSTKPELPRTKVKLIEGNPVTECHAICEILLYIIDCVDRKYGLGTFLKNEHDIKKRCNQKCIDISKKLKKQAAK